MRYQGDCDYRVCDSIVIYIIEGWWKAEDLHPKPCFRFQWYSKPCWC